MIGAKGCLMGCRGPETLKLEASRRQHWMCLAKAFSVLQYLFNRFPVLTSFCSCNKDDFFFIGLTLTHTGGLGVKDELPPHRLPGKYFRGLSRSTGQWQWG